ncbi:hypothetical protein [Massilia phyllosphaerae]|uniref:hypothetical protein n=1 Tax=Massilia phyllosphaerae TaxID=3106034 RepID=UPI002B1CAE3D|nr:hypothetical protein [Massilia sp. SGZ-792]
MFQVTLILACVLCGAGGFAVAAWSIHYTRKHVAAQSAQPCCVQGADVQMGASVDLAAFQKFTVEEVARAFGVPAHLIRDVEFGREFEHWQVREALSQWTFDAWQRARTEQAHREFMERTANLPPCDASIEGVARYMGAPI